MGVTPDRGLVRAWREQCQDAEREVRKLRVFLAQLKDDPTRVKLIDAELKRSHDGRT
jgi:hypothetical protein